MSAEKAATGNKHYLHVAITALLIFGANLCPTIAPLTAYGTKVVILFAGIIYGYATMGMTLPSLMALVSLGFTGFDTVPGVLKTAIGNGTVLYVFAILMLSQMLMETGLSDKLINWLVTRKIAKGKPWMLSFLLMLAAYLAAFLVNMVPPCIILWGILVDLFDKVGYKKGDKWPIVMVFGVLYASTLGAFVTPFQIAPVANYGMLTAASGGALVLPFGTYFVWAFVVGTILFALWFLFARYVIRPDVSLLMAEDLFEEDNEPLTREQKIVAIIFVVFVIGLFLPTFLPEGSILRFFFDNLGNAGWSLAMLLIALVSTAKGKPLFEFADLFAKSVIWDITLMMACIMTISGALADPATGIPAIVNNLIRPLMGSMGMVPFWILILFVVLVLGNLTNTVAVSAVFIVVMYSVSIGTDFNMLLFAGFINFAGNVCLLSPACCPNAAMMYGQKEWITSKYCLVFAAFVFVTVYLVCVGIGLPLGFMLF